MSQKGDKTFCITIEDILRIEQEYILSLEGYTISEIAELTDRDYDIVFYDLSVLLQHIDSQKAEELSSIQEKTFEKSKR